MCVAIIAHGTAREETTVASEIACASHYRQWRRERQGSLSAHGTRHHDDGK